MAKSYIEIENEIKIVKEQIKSGWTRLSPLERKASELAAKLVKLDDNIEINTSSKKNMHDNTNVDMLFYKATIKMLQRDISLRTGYLIDFNKLKSLIDQSVSELGKLEKHLILLEKQLISHSPILKFKKKRKQSGRE